MKNIDLTSYLAILSEKIILLSPAKIIDKFNGFQPCAKRMAIDVHVHHIYQFIFIST